MRILGGKKKGVSLATRRGSGTRPLSARVKKSLFGILEPFLYNAHFFDFFAGNGAVGLEALSRGAIQSSFYEKDYQCIKIIKKNIKSCAYESISVVHQCDVMKYIPRLKTDTLHPTVIFLGPPYGYGLAHESLQLISEKDPFRNQSLIIAETRKNEILNENYDKYLLTREKFYGDTKLTFYQRSMTNAESLFSD